MGYLATGEFFENMLQLKRFEIMNRKWLLSYRNDAISYRNARGFGGMLPEKILKRLMQSGAFLIFDRLSLKSTTICYKKISIIHYNWLCVIVLLCYIVYVLLLCVILLPEKFKKTCSS